MPAQQSGKTKTLGSKISALGKFKAQIDKLNKDLSELKKQREELELEIIKDLETDGTTMGSNRVATVSISEQEVAHATDPEVAIAWMRKTNNMQLLQRRFSNPAYRELMARRRGKKIPGIDTFVKKSLNYRAK